MTGSEHELDVYLGEKIIATLTLENEQLNWQYTQHWLQAGYAISPHLPLSDIIPTMNTQRYLRNLFPEGNGLEVLLSSFHLSRSNTFGLIGALGIDTPGVLCFVPHNKSLPTKTSFRKLLPDEMENRLRTRDEFPLIVWDGKPRLSVAGVQDKINVVLSPDDELGFGEGRLCSTHILKFEKQKSSNLVLNEYMTMRLAKHCGLQVANVNLLRFGEFPALLIERFDRKLITMKSVKRRQVIDGCQALNLPPEYKYERNFGSSRDVAHIREGASFAKIFDFANKCINPAETKSEILDWVLFNLLVYNYDAHGKNISFFVNSHGISLAPFYDLVNINLYPEFEHEMAMGIGDEFEGTAIQAYQLADFAESCQLARPYLRNKLENIIHKMVLALKQNALLAGNNEAEEQYIKQYHSMVRERCGYLLRQVNELMSVKL